LIALLVVAVTALLQFWRPYFHLTDDNLSGYLPAATEFNQRLWSGRWPFISEGVFGGNHNQLADPSVFGLLSPWMVLFSWISLTPFAHLLVDIVSLCNSLVIALAFGWSALWLRDHFRLTAPDWLIIALSVSYVFTPYNLRIGSSWIGFLNGQASMPLMLVGMLMTRSRHAVLLQSAALLYALFGGHAHTFVMTCLFSGVLAVGVSVGTRSLRPMVRTLLAGILAGVVMLPVLAQSMTGFSGSARDVGVPMEDARARRLDPPILAGTMVTGPLATIVAHAVGAYSEGMATTFSVSYSPANLLFLLVLIRAAKQRQRIPNVAWALLCCFGAAALMVSRPEWLAALTSRLPVLRSLQWPFREIWVLQFALHGFLLFASALVSVQSLRVLLVAGALITGITLGSPPPTFNAFDIDRQVLLSGRAERYWQTLRAAAGGPPHIVVGIEPHLIPDYEKHIPYSLLGAYNYGSLYGFVSQSGYTFNTDLRRWKRPGSVRPFYSAGAYRPTEARWLASQDSTLWLIELTRVKPAEWDVHTSAGVRRYRLDEPSGQIVERK
ncbi:MAG: hypothetical protein V4617_13835, partial [Gemmatimonadota bacterium]